MEATVAALQQQLQELNQRVVVAETAAAAAQAAATSTPNGPGGPAATSTVSRDILDTRVLGKPDVFQGDQKSWRDWAIVMRSYSGLVDVTLVQLMKEAEVSTTPVLRAVLEEPAARSSFRLYHILLMLCKGQALDRLITAGEGEGLEGWRLLVE